MKNFISFYFKGLFLLLTDSNFRTFTRLYLNNIVKKRFTEYTFSVNGYKVLVADITSFLWQYKEIFVSRFYDFKTTSAQPVIYDCGANIGTSVLFFSSKYPTAKIYAYEASPTIYRVLEKNIKQNNVLNVQAFQNAVWIKNEQLEFSEEGADGGSVYSLSNTPKVKVQALDFLEVLAKEEKIDMLKMDIEGAENDLIPHLAPALHKVDNMFIEYHSFNNGQQHLAELLAVLKQHQFRFYIRHVNDRKSPFIDKAKDKEMDMQLNIFAYKN